MNDFVEENRETYDAIASQFSLSRENRFGELPLFADFFPKQGTIVDLGCGTGRLYQFLAENQGLDSGVRYIGVDQSEGQIEAAQQYGGTEEWLVAPLDAVPLEDGVVDCLGCFATFHHVPPGEARTAAVQEMYRLLKAGGTLLISNWNFQSTWVQQKMEHNASFDDGVAWEVDGDHVIVPWLNNKREIIGNRHYWSILPDEMTGLLEENGFDVVEWFYERRGVRVNDVGIGMNVCVVARKS